MTTIEEQARQDAINAAASLVIVKSIRVPIRLRIVRETVQRMMWHMSRMHVLTDVELAEQCETQRRWLFQQAVRTEAVRLMANASLTAADGNWPLLSTYTEQPLETFWSMQFALSSEVDGTTAAIGAEATARQSADTTLAGQIAAITWSTLTGKPSFATVATSGTYDDLSGKPTLGTIASHPTSDFTTPAQVDSRITALIGGAAANFDTLGEIAAQLATDESAVSALITTVSGKYAQPAGTISQYVRGDGSIAAFPSLNFDANGAAASAQAFAIQRANHTGTQTASTISDFSTAAVAAVTFSTITGKPTTLAGYGITDPIVLTSGSYSNPAWITGLAWSKITGAPSFLTANQSITLSGDATGSGTTAITVTLAASGVGAGTYTSVTVDAKGRVTAGTNPTPAARAFTTPTFSSATTATVLSVTRDADVTYAFDAVIAITLLGGQGMTAILEYADNSGMSTNLVQVDANGAQSTGIAGLSQIQTIKVSGTIPAGKYRRVRFVAVQTGTATTPTAPTTIKSGQEVLQ